jgi:hypothetical protein
MKDDNLTKRISEIEGRVALKELVDTFITKMNMSVKTADG